MATESRSIASIDATDAATSQSIAAPAQPRRFRYVDDPICIVAMALYVVNRLVLKPRHIGGWLVHDYLNDLLCLPIFLPIILRLQSAFGIRRHHAPPTLLEVIHNWVIFSIVFEVVLPRLSAFDSVSDPFDCVGYLLGGLGAYLFWKRFYRTPRSRLGL